MSPEQGPAFLIGRFIRCDGGSAKPKATISHTALIYIASRYILRLAGRAMEAQMPLLEILLTALAMTLGSLLLGSGPIDWREAM